MNPEQIIQDAMKKYSEAENDLVEAESNFKDIDSQTKSILAKCKLKFDGSHADRETEALADQEYIKHLEVLSDLRKIYLECKAKKEVEEKRWETARSLLSYEKGKINIL